MKNFQLCFFFVVITKYFLNRSSSKTLLNCKLLFLVSFRSTRIKGFEFVE